MRTRERECSGCRYWSEMVARAGGGTDNPRGDLEALCLSDESPHASKYMTGDKGADCPAFAHNTRGAVDDPPDYGEEVREAYAEQARAKHVNGAPMYAPDGTLLDEQGNRSIFDDVDA